MALSMQLRAPAARVQGRRVAPRGVSVARPVSFSAHYSFDIRPTRVSLRSRKAVVVEAAKKSVGDLSKADLEASIWARLRCAPRLRAPIARQLITAARCNRCATSGAALRP